MENEEDKTLLPTEPAQDGWIGEEFAPTGGGHPLHRWPAGTGSEGSGRLGGDDPAWPQPTWSNDGFGPLPETEERDPDADDPLPTTCAAACDGAGLHQAWVGLLRSTREEAQADANEHNAGCAVAQASVPG